MTTAQAIANATPRITSLAPQFLVDDLQRSIAYYRDRLGFSVKFEYGGFYAGVSRDGCELHLKEAPKTVADREHRRREEHLDASIGVEGVDALYDELRRRGAEVIKPLEIRPWGVRDFYVADPDGYILCFGE
jgi:catechol 2,3-dioxygenase-like lactoylglutathione lyase family enzyme